MTSAITRIERARGFLEAARLSGDWVRDRGNKALGFLLEHKKLTIQKFEKLCPDVYRRSLQRELKGLLGKDLIMEVGAGPTDPTRH